MSRRVLCKFVCNSVHKPDEKSHPNQTDIRMEPVTLDDAHPWDHEFWEATPCGDLNLMLTRPEAAALFEPGATYYVEIWRADETETP